jgi:hypothetical protein
MTNHEHAGDRDNQRSRARDGDTDVHLAAALPQLRTEVGRRAEHQLRVRRAVTALVAAALVGIGVVGSCLMWRNDTSAPPLPGTSPTPTDSAPQPRPSKPIPPWPTQQPKGAIADTDWERATITLPNHPGCPSGAVTFRREEFKGANEVIGPATYPRVIIGSANVIYGDVTGDRVPEAVLAASCWQGEEDSGDGEGQLLVVGSVAGALHAMGWAAPRGAMFTDYWVEDRRLYVDAKPWHDDWGYRLGEALTYEWNGQVFARIEDSGLTGLVPAQPGGTGPVIDVAPVAALTGCPATTLRFPSDGRTTAAGMSWELALPGPPEYAQHLVDLHGDGKRRLLVVMTCGRPLSGPPPGSSFLAVLEPRTDGSYGAIDAIRVVEGWIVRGWRYATGYLTLELLRDEMTQEPRYAWNGEYFQEAS